LTFGTDRYGNMTCQTNGSTQGLCPNWAFDTTTNRINSSGFTYDAAGNLTNDGTHTYQWDAEGQMTAVDGGTTASYEYDALGRRVYANIEGGNEFWYFCDPAGNLVADWVPGGLGIDELMEPVAGRVLASYQNDRSDVFLKHQNALGSWGLITRPDGVVAQDEIYYPWGQQWAGIYVVESNFARMGWHDVESDLDWTPARRYESSLGRWLSPDPAGLDAADPSDPQTWNMYAYVRNNPTTFTDPDGQEMNCTQDQNGNLHCTVTDPSEDDFPKAMMELGGIAIPQEELGPWMPLVGAGLFAAGWCMQTHCVTNLTSLLSQEKKSPPPPTPATPAVSNTASPNPDPNQQKYNPNDKKKADNLIRGRLKSSRSYSSEYGNKTYGEIKELAKQGDMKAQAMKKLIEQSERLMEKVGNK